VGLPGGYANGRSDAAKAHRDAKHLARLGNRFGDCCAIREETEDGTTTTGLRLMYVVSGVRSMPWIKDVADTRMVREEIGDDGGVALLGVHANLQGLQARWSR